MGVNIIGLDIGGTKCAVTYGISETESIRIVDKVIFATTNVQDTIANLLKETAGIMKKNGLDSSNTAAIGIACGGPLDSKKGIVMSPPNLSDWDNIPIVDIVTTEFNIPAQLQNDANACAIAEWKFGAGRKSSNMAFLTYGTGLGAGIIINDKLYTGANDNAGELGHIRLSAYGPVGYGKMGSFEGFCSGGGIAQLARDFIYEKIQMGEKVSWCPADQINKVTAKMVAEAAWAGDEIALEIYRTSAVFMGKGLSILIDILNPEVIVLGGIYTRNEQMLRPIILENIKKEALPLSAQVCEIKSAELGENIGDYAALSVAINLLNS